MAINDLNLFLDGTRYLEDYETIKSLNIKSTDYIVEMAKLQFILTNGTKLEIVVAADTTWKEAKEMVMKKGVDFVSDDLYIDDINGTKLDMTKKMIDYSISLDTTVQEYTKISVIEQETNQKTELMVKLSDTVDELEEQIFEKTKINKQE